MLLPSKIVTPQYSIIYLASIILTLIKVHSMRLDDIILEVQDELQTNTENIILALDFLYLIRKVEFKDEIIEIVLQ